MRNPPPFLDALITQQDYGVLKVKVYRKISTPTNISTLLPTTNSLTNSVIRTLYERSDNITTQESDRQEEIRHIDTPLTHCRYPEWSFKEVRRIMDNRLMKAEKGKKKKGAREKSDGEKIMGIPFVTGISEEVPVHPEKTWDNNHTETPQDSYQCTPRTSEW